MRQILPTSKRVIIVGATSGIGRELALLYLRAGHRVGVTGRRQELLDSLQAEFPGQVEINCYDVTGSNNRRELESLVQRLGGLDLLVYSSGYGAVSDGSDAAADAAIDEATIGINVRGFIETIHYGWAYFVRQGHGHLATISSIASIRGNSRAPAYSATKAFQSNYFEGLYMKARRLGLKIAVTDIEPGFVATKMAQGEGLFWVAPVEKAALQIYRALEARRRKVYVTRRWRLIAWMMRWMPGMVYHRIA